MGAATLPGTLGEATPSSSVFEVEANVEVEAEVGAEADADVAVDAGVGPGVGVVAVASGGVGTCDRVVTTGCKVLVMNAAMDVSLKKVKLV